MCEYLRRIRREVQTQLDSIQPQLIFGQLDHTKNRIIDIDQLACAFIGACKPQDVLNDPDAALRLGMNLLNAVGTRTTVLKQ